MRGYAAGDRAALKPLLTPAVMASFEAGIAAREVPGVFGMGNAARRAFDTLTDRTRSTRSAR